MNYLSFFMAYKYLRSKKNSRFTAIISKSSIIGIALGIAAIVVVMSIMNGFQLEVTSKLLKLTPDITVWPQEKTDVLQQKLQQEMQQQQQMMQAKEMTKQAGQILGTPMMDPSKNPAMMEGMAEAEPEMETPPPEE